MQTVFAYIADIRAYIGLDNENLVGIQVDYKNKTFKRLAGAVNLTKGSDFDKFTMFGGRKRCNVADDGSIVAWYGDADYKEDGSMGQVMVYQPKFYYLVCPVEYDPIDTGIGYHLRKANYYVSEKPRAGFRLHPAFYDASGNEIDYFLTSAYEGGVAKEYTVDGKTSVCWRGKENFWGNIWKFVYGINIWGNGKMGGGQPYICSDFNFAENKNSGNYEGAGFTATNVEGYISAMGYSTICDWLFIASECTGNSSLPVGDYTYITQNLNGYRIAPLGGRWTDGGVAGAFSWYLDYGVGRRYRFIGGRLVYIPTKDSSVYNTAIASWKEQMAVKT